MSSSLKCAIVQYPIAWHNTTQNSRLITERCRNLSADVIVLPETFNTGFSMHPERVGAQEQKEAVQVLSSLAKEKQALVLASTIIGSEKEGYHNRLHACFPNGELQIYNKKHLFTFAKEHEHFQPGDDRITVEFKGWKINPLICYDLRFPVFSRNDKEFPFDVQVFVSNWPGVRISAWDILLRARAVENQCYVLGSNRVGKDDNGIEYNGHSQAISPYGDVLAKLEDGEDGIVSVSLDKGELERFRKKFPVLQDADHFTLH